MPTATCSENRPVEILLVGFGAVGIVYSYLLESKGKARVTAVARSKYDTILEKGINIHSLRWGHVHGWRPYRLVKRLEDALVHRFDYVLLCTKSVPEISTAADMLSPLLTRYPHPQPTYVLCQNGLGVEKHLYAGLKEQGHSTALLSCAVYIMANVLDNGDVIHVNSDKIVLGVYRPLDQPAEVSSKDQSVLDLLVDAMNASGFDASSTPDIGLEKFNKNLWNASIGMVSCLTRLTPAQWACDPNAVESGYGIVRNMLKELILVGRSIGYDERALPSSLVEEKIEQEKSRITSSKEGSKFVTSCLLDLRAGKPFELEVILGEAVRIGQAHGCDITTLDMVYGSLLVIQAKLIEEQSTGPTQLRA